MKKSFMILCVLLSCRYHLLSQDRYQYLNMHAIHTGDAHQEDKQKTEKYYKDFASAGITKDVEIPVVFHVVLTDSKAKIVSHQIEDQLEALNRDFAGLSPCSRNDRDAAAWQLSRAYDTGIRFCLAADTSASYPNQGLIYYESPYDSWGTEQLIHELAAPWNPQQYLNVWICKLYDNAAGYSVMPGARVSWDGIMIDYRYIASGVETYKLYNEGKTLTHLIANYLGLYPLWGDGRKCTDDGIEDTPIHNAANYGNPGIGHISTCAGYPREMIINYMDNTADSIKCMFTLGQMMRMQAALSDRGIRGQLASGITMCKLEEWDYQSSGLKIDFFPNPATHSLSLSIRASEEMEVSVFFTGPDGKRWMDKTFFISSGVFETGFDLSAFPEGIYLATVRSKTTTNTQLLTIVK